MSRHGLFDPVDRCGEWIHFKDRQHHAEALCAKRPFPPIVCRLGCGQGFPGGLHQMLQVTPPGGAGAKAWWLVSRLYHARACGWFRGGCPCEGGADRLNAKGTGRASAGTPSAAGLVVFAARDEGAARARLRRPKRLRFGGGVVAGPFDPPPRSEGCERS